MEDGARSRGVDGRLGHTDRLLVRGDGTGGFDGGLVDADGLLQVRAAMGNVNSNTGYLDLVLVVGLETRTVFTLSNVDDRVVGAVGSVDLNARLGVGGLRSVMEGNMSAKKKRSFSSFVLGPVAWPTAPVRCDWVHPGSMSGVGAGEKKKRRCLGAETNGRTRQFAQAEKLVDHSPTGQLIAPRSPK